MTLWEAYKSYLAAKRTVTALELIGVEKRIDAQEIELGALKRTLGALDAKLEANQNTKLMAEVNVLKATVEKLSSRLVGFSKTGIS